MLPGIKTGLTLHTSGAVLSSWNGGRRGTIGGSSDSGKKGFEEGYKDATSNKASASTASSVASVVPEFSEDDYKAECQTVDYKELCRYPEKYEGTKIVVKVKVSQIIDANFSGSEKSMENLHGQQRIRILC